jgi:hypothetical protein
MTTTLPFDAYGGDRAERFRIHAYVRQGGVRKRQSLMGQVTFAWVYQNRPQDHRYAVLSDWDCNAHARAYHVIDLYEVKLDGGGRPVTPHPRWTLDELDAAIATATLLYGVEAQQLLAKTCLR